MPSHTPCFEVRFARSADDLEAVQRLRYDVFVTELGAESPMIDHNERRETDKFDAVADHLMLLDLNLDNAQQVVGVYRIMNAAQAIESKGFSCESEYNLDGLKTTDRTLLELSRSCLHPDYRGGIAMYQMWRRLGQHIAATQTDILFGVASFLGADPLVHADALNMLAANHLSVFNVQSRAPVALPQRQFDKKQALRATPALIKAYLRLGGAVGQGAFVDHAFNTTDVCMILDVAKMNAKQRAIYS